MRSTISAVAGACASALFVTILAASTAVAQPGPYVVGMSQEEAVEVLKGTDTPYRIINRAGSTMQNCTVTEQRDRGYDIERDWEWDSSKEEWKLVETKVWRGIGLTIFCD